MPLEIRLSLDESLGVGQVPQPLRGPASVITGRAQLAANELDRGRDADAAAFEASRHGVFDERSESRVLAELHGRVIGPCPVLGVFIPPEQAKAGGLQRRPRNRVVSLDGKLDVEGRPCFLAPELDSETSDQGVSRPVLFEDLNSSRNARSLLVTAASPLRT